MPPKRMTGKQLKAIRDERGETGEEFGAYLARLVGEERSYNRQEINAWESGRRAVPAKIELALLQARR